MFLVASSSFLQLINICAPLGLLLCERGAILNPSNQCHESFEPAHRACEPKTRLSLRRCHRHAIIICLTFWATLFKADGGHGCERLLFRHPFPTPPHCLQTRTQISSRWDFVWETSHPISRLRPLRAPLSSTSGLATLG